MIKKLTQQSKERIPCSLTSFLRFVSITKIGPYVVPLFKRKFLDNINGFKHKSTFFFMKSQVRYIITGGMKNKIIK